MGRQDCCKAHRKLGDKRIEITAITVVLHCHAVLYSLCAQKEVTTPFPSSLYMLAFACL